MSPAKYQRRLVKAILLFFFIALFMLSPANAQDASRHQDNKPQNDHTTGHQQPPQPPPPSPPPPPPPPPPPSSSSSSLSSLSSSSTTSSSVATTTTMSTALLSPAEASLEARLRRLERLVAERKDIVEDYNLQQLDETPLSTLLKDYIWKAVSSRPLFRYRQDPRCSSTNFALEDLETGLCTNGMLHFIKSLSLQTIEMLREFVKRFVGLWEVVVNSALNAFR